MTFEIKYRGRKTERMKVQALVDHGKYVMTVYFDGTTGAVLYPARIGTPVIGLEILLNNDREAFCSFPPSIPVFMLDNIMCVLSSVESMLDAAWAFLQKEQEKIKKENE